ncbi:MULTISPECIES: sugar transferase [unclassified Granulicatella]|uniref:sugar transferase n=1 Tax=unclassified Granulicatella TaxID=2630493 RepID=UPI0010732B51|nr:MULTISPECIES: sugar transferase [unclassified Granulicatella]MBF0780172.1 sugar transferase [Granulicatella sp. 19428wC4_WM01]TFU95723.1 hypothetical protein E4T68_03590 [Granulicatella sp. WM01]
MKVHITNLHGHAQSSVAQIAQNMVTKIAMEMGIREIGIYAYPVQTDSPSELSKRIDGMMAGLGRDDIVIMQSPTWNNIEFDEIFIRKIKLYSDVKFAIFIHDIIPLMFKSNEYLIDRVIAMYNSADVIIVPSQKMLDELYRRGLTVKRIIIQHMWDYPVDLMLDTPKFSQTINFAGNPERFTFINEWTYANPLRVFTGQTIDTSEINVIHEPWRANHELLIDLAKFGGFGLVWSQKSDVDYYELNISYKLGSYLAAGLPVIVQDTLSNQQIIKDNHIGIVVKDLEEANERISRMTELEYNEMVENVKNYRGLITQGFYTKKVLVDTIHALLSQ